MNLNNGLMCNEIVVGFLKRMDAKLYLKLHAKMLLVILLIYWMSQISNYTIAQSIVPLPVELAKNEHQFTLNKETKIIYDKGFEIQAKQLATFLAPATGWDLGIVVQQNEVGNSIVLSHVDNIPNEGYALHVFDDHIQIKASTQAGIFYGFQTLLQLFPTEIYNKQRQRDIGWTIEGVDINDDPSYPWRGMMLDVSRYFFDKDYVKKFIDMMAMYKLNTLHLHLIDDAGWRLEIKKYPLLTSVGAWRGEDEKRTGGYYTQEDIKEMVAYAALKNIDIIPEIEIPAHTLAAIAAYPFLSCDEKPVKVQEQHSISGELYCVGKESTFEFLEDVFAETARLFSSKYIHIGGDEARYGNWKRCVHCQKRKADLGLQDESELQIYFNRRVQEMVKKYGKTIVGWDEIIEEGLKEKAVGMVWHHKEKAFEATKLGHDIVMIFTDQLYFDFPESDIPGEVQAATWMPPIPLEKVYRFNPLIKGLEEKYRPQLLGGQGALWSDQFIQGTALQEIELINENRSEAYFDYLAFPRMSALAEAVWTPNSLMHWEDFEQRMEYQYNRYDQAGYGYRVPLPKLIKKEQTSSGYILTLGNVVHGSEIRFTTDGTKPNVYSTIYTEPIHIKRIQDFQAITVVNRHQFSLPLNFPVSYPQFNAYGSQMGAWRVKDVYANQYAALEKSVTGKIDKNGIYEVAFLHTDGENSLEIEGIKVLKNGHVIAEDAHSARVGKTNEHNVYSFEINNYETGATYRMSANIMGIEGNDSNGVIYIKIKEH